MDKPFGFVYKTTNKINGKIYIGQHRYKFCKRYDKYYLGAGKLLRPEIQKYGASNFDREILVDCFSQQELNEKEIFYISFYNSTNPDIGYNILSGGLGADKGFSEETRRKIGEASKLRTKENHPMYGKHQTTEWRQKISKALSGRKLSDEHKKNLRSSKIGTKLSIETRAKISEANRRRALKRKLDQIEKEK